jgi:anti-sigma B factor antagonist
MSTALTFTTGARPDGTVVLAAAGEIDMSNAEDFSVALAGTGDGAFVVDLTGVEYIDSAGLAAIFPYVDRVQLVARPLLAPVLTIAGLDDLTTVEEG